jgi:hypothetical protein
MPHMSQTPASIPASSIPIKMRKHVGVGAIEKIMCNNSKNDRLVQLADMCAVAIVRSYRNDRADHDRWRTMLKDRIEDVWEFGRVAPHLPIPT